MKIFVSQLWSLTYNEQEMDKIMGKAMKNTHTEIPMELELPLDNAMKALDQAFSGVKWVEAWQATDQDMWSSYFTSLWRVNL